MTEDEESFTVEDEISRLNAENEILSQKNGVLEDGIKGLLKENALLRVDTNVLKARIQELENTTILARQEDSLELLQNRLDFKIQEAEDLRQKYEEDQKIIYELESQIQQQNVDHQEEKDQNKQLDNLTVIIDSLQKENEKLKNMIKELSKKHPQSESEVECSDTEAPPEDEH